MKEYLILQVTTKLLLPFILLFALYVQFHGDYGPGGGFQAGVIFAAGIILYALVFGLKRAKRVVPPSAIRWILGAGVLLYIGVGIVDMALGGNFLEYSVMAHDAKEGQHMGILLVEAGVGLTVFGAITLIFYLFAGQDA